MQFNSLYFVILFLPAAVIGCRLLDRKSRKASNLFLLGMSLLFYAFAGWKSLVLLFGSILVNWGISRALVLASSGCSGGSDAAAGTLLHESGRNGRAKAWLVTGILINAGVLVVFKYTNFFLENLDALLGRDWPLVHLVLPLGISFTTFTQISWLVDSYRGETADVTFPEYALYVAFFPKLTQGPIMFQKEFMEQARRPHVWNWEQACRGLSLFILGLSKKLLLADRFGTAADWGFHFLVLTTRTDMILTILSYTFQIYFDFSGYSDMASGVAILLGWEVPINFDSPYKALSITDFWRRWHMSLTRFLREYLYFPLGGSRKGKVRTYLNIMIVFLVSGFWHGAAWTFVLWGVLHGALQCLERAGHAVLVRIPGPIRWIVTFLLVSLLWALFRSASIPEFARAMLHVFGPLSFEANPEMLANFNLPGLRYVLSHLGIAYSEVAVSAVSAIVVFAFSFWLVLVPENTQRRQYRTNALTMVCMAALFVICLLSMSSVSTFIYNNF